ncbi:arsenic resistance N-acetyltransferase ArsN2 [Solilutibacter tolerans]|uniref:Amino-acid N-acetyltransferase n=1 Tax=Solilutibacter tolerans TaxID=1604334 RepID=A0A1N6YLD2_9GAMM|nr:arsenic resistance N-acetyltransferase ArsN2 [Lysobacter tolerans]SIR15271.1 amino-acid N-acetyltransferase [Lysobacter tolerans]
MKQLKPNDNVRSLLEKSDLPTSDLDTCRSLNLYGIEEGNVLKGTVGYELYGHDILLRSLAVDPEFRGTGLGRELVRQAESLARQNGAHTAWLLTTTAESFFTENGYSKVDRQTAPESIRATSQFSSLCPASSAFMCKRLVA